ncbi:MAG: DUF2238 domain-containing protein [Candidatus Woesearchaeota archaeon]
MKNKIVFWLVSFSAVFIWSVYKPYNYFIWFMEVAPALIVLFIIVLTYKRFKLTELSYWLIWVHAIILMIGGHYTYARTPIGDWMNLIYETGRNNYDKIGHFAQGAIPAIVAREILIRKNVLKRGAWLFFIVVSICLAASAFYEFIEAGSAIVAGDKATDFLATQGFVWDTQTDMFLAMIGAITSLAVFSRLHDRQLKQIRD